MALRRLLARLGASDPIELRMERAELSDGFDIGRFGTAPTKFDVADVFPMTGHYLQALPLDQVADQIAAFGVPDDLAEAVWMVTRDTITTLKDRDAWWTLFRDGAEPDIDDEDKEFVAQAMALLPESPLDTGTWKSWTGAVKEATGRKGRGLFMPLRKALTGQSHGPDMSGVMPLLQVIKAR
jgi:glutamyl-tRNA synthetase